MFSFIPFFCKMSIGNWLRFLIGFLFIFVSFGYGVKSYVEGNNWDYCCVGIFLFFAIVWFFGFF
jgi:hypothetical protein